MGRTEEILKSPRKRKQFFGRLRIIFVLGLGALLLAFATANYFLSLRVPLSLFLFAILGYIALASLIAHAAKQW